MTMNARDEHARHDGPINMLLHIADFFADEPMDDASRLDMVRELRDVAALLCEEQAARSSHLAILERWGAQMAGAADEALRLLDIISKVRGERMDDGPDGAWPIVRSDLRSLLGKWSVLQTRVQEV